jgi:DNA-binding response OmpR family regulator
MRALVVEDERKVAAALREALHTEQFEVVVSYAVRGVGFILGEETRLRVRTTG